MLGDQGKLPKQMVSLLSGAGPGTETAGLRSGSTATQGFLWCF